ncbi:MAG: aldo/keto reductase [Methanosarcinaceae archaeon]|nr:aldo/keto reductase [Methanosarcinaceae archaeon]
MGRCMMEFTRISGIGTKVSRIGLGSQPIGYHSKEAGRQTIDRALEHGINLIDTSPVYGNGRAEEIIGETLKKYGREEIVISSKTGLEKTRETTVRNSSPEFMLKDIEGSLRRLRTDYIDIYQIHWPDPLQSMEETARTMRSFQEEGKIRAIGISNFDLRQMEDFSETLKPNTCQCPYNIFESKVESDILPYCQDNEIVFLAYRSLCQGLLTGKMKADADFTDHPVKRADPKFQLPRYRQYLEAVSGIDSFSKEMHSRGILDLAIQWILGHDNTIALWGAWKPEHIESADSVFGWNPDKETLYRMTQIIKEIIKDPVGPEFLEPSTR